MVTMPYTPISSYVEVTVANPCGELQSQGIMLLRRLRADGLIKTDQYMLYREHEQQEIHIAADPFAVVTVTVEGVYLRLLESKQLKHGPLEQDPLKQVEKLLASIPLPDATAYGYIAFDLARCYMPTDRLQDLHAPLLSFFVPQLELCISPETIRIKSLDVRVLEGVLDKIITMTWEQPEPLATPERFVVTEDDASWYMQGVQTIVDAIRRERLLSRGTLIWTYWKRIGLPKRITPLSVRIASGWEPTRRLVVAPKHCLRRTPEAISQATRSPGRAGVARRRKRTLV